MEAEAQNEHRSTRERLLTAAGEVFAEVGYHAATVRDICARAGANVASVNYYFRDKETLYSEAIRYAHRCAQEAYPRDMGGKTEVSPEMRLRFFVKNFLHNLLDAGRPAWHGKMMSREMVEPTAALDLVVEEGIRPNEQLLRRIVRDLRPQCSEREEIFAAYSVIGQCLLYFHSRPVLERLHPELRFDQSMVADLTEHIVSFSLAAFAKQGREGALDRR